MDTAFKALNDPGRRRLLDELFVRDGQTLGELCAYLPEMTRFGVMNHLGVLEQAELIGFLNRYHNNIADAGIPSSGTAEHFDTIENFCT